MDEVLLRRLLGATVLFLLVFALASLLPDAAPLRPVQGNGQVVTYDLTTGEQQMEEAPEVTEAAPAPVPDKAPEATPAPAAKPSPRTAVQLQEALALSDVNSWYVQVGSFENQTNARSALVKLYELGMPTTIQSVQVKKELWYRVRVGPYTAESKAQKALKAIRAQGYKEAKLVHTGG